MNTVFLAVSANGLSAARDLARDAGAAVWCDARAISADEFEKLPPGTLTRFSQALDNKSAVADAIDTIAEHHPGSTIFVETSVQEAD